MTEGDWVIRNRAADLLEQVGWCQGELFRHDSLGEVVGRCAVGALMSAGRDNPVDYPFRLAVQVARELELVALSPAIRDDTAAVLETWNDAPERTKEEVVAALRGQRRGLPVSSSVEKVVIAA